MGRKPGSKDNSPRKRRSDAGQSRKGDAVSKAQSQATADMSNGVNPEAAKRAMKRLQDGHEARLSIMGRAMNECAKEHEIDKRALGVAKDEGVPIRPMKAAFKLWLLDRKKEDIRANLEPDDAALLAQLHVALGGFVELPLGQAAIADAEQSAESRGKAAIGSILGFESPNEAEEDSDETGGFRQLSDEEREADMNPRAPGEFDAKAWPN